MATNDDDRPAFEDLVAPYRAELHAHCYRMLGSVHDADDALQDTLLGAWRGFSSFEGRGSFRSWLYRIATNACLHLIGERPKRLLAADYRAADAPDAGLDDLVHEPVWLEPYPDDPHAKYESLERVELAFVAALQHLPPTQRTVLILREVLGFSAAEVAEQFATTVASVDSALQRARRAIEQRVPPTSQQATLRELGDIGQRELVERFIFAWEHANVGVLLELLASDASFSMPPIPNWFQGREDVGRFFAERVFATPWRLRPMKASGQLAFACYQGPSFRLGALNVITLADRSIVASTGFLDPAVHARFDLPPTLAGWGAPGVH